MKMAVTRGLWALPSLSLFLTLTSLRAALVAGQTAAAKYASSQENATATYYGGLDGAGTIEQAACGYGDLNATTYGMMNAAASIAMWSNGAVCGACFQVSCRSSGASNRWCRWGASVIVTVTNQCPEASEGGWCNNPKHHLDMAYPAWFKIGTDKVAGVLGTTMKRVACPRTGGIKIRTSGKDCYTNFVFLNVAGSGDLASVEVSTDRGKTWSVVAKNWGAVWSKGGVILRGKPLSFRLKTGFAADTLTLLDAVPATWVYGQEFQTSTNFPATPANPTGTVRGRSRGRGRRHVRTVGQMVERKEHKGKRHQRHTKHGKK